MKYFIVSNSFAAPFFSDTDMKYVKARDGVEALKVFVKEYTHPAGLFSAAVWKSADDYHQNKDALYRWDCNHSIEQQRLTKGKEAYLYRGHAPGDFMIDGMEHKVENPKGGKIFNSAGRVVA